MWVSRAKRTVQKRPSMCSSSSSRMVARWPWAFLCWPLFPSPTSASTPLTSTSSARSRALSVQYSATLYLMRTRPRRPRRRKPTCGFTRRRPTWKRQCPRNVTRWALGIRPSVSSQPSTWVCMPHRTPCPLALPRCLRCSATRLWIPMASWKLTQRCSTPKRLAEMPVSLPATAIRTGCLSK